MALAAFRRLALIAAGAVTMIATAVGLLLSAGVGLFGYQASLVVPYATESLVIEFTGAAVLAVAAVTLLAARPHRGTNPFRPNARMEECGDDGKFAG